MASGRILYLSTVDVSLPDGPGVNEREFLLSLVERCHDRVAALVPEPTRDVDAEVRRIIVPLWRAGGRPTRLGIQSRVLWGARRVLREFRPDLIVCRAGAFPLGFLAVAMMTNTPVVLKTLGGGTMTGPGRRWWLAPLALVHRQLLRALLRRVRAVDACTAELCERARREYGVEPTRLALVPNATNVMRFRPGPSAEARRALGLSGLEPVIGYAGGRPWERGGEEIIRALPQLRQRWPRVGALIVGGGPGMDRLRALADGLGLGEAVRLTGSLPYEAMPLHVQAMDVGVALDRLDRLDEVGNSNQKVRQYLACGRPVVASPGGQLEVEQLEVGREVPPRDIERFVLAVRELLEAPIDVSEERAMRARVLAERELSTSATLSQRFEFWARCLPEVS